MTLPSCPNSLPLLPTSGAYCGSSRCSPLCSAGFPISVSAPNPLLISEAAIHVGYSVLKTLTAVYPEWVRSQTSPFSSPFTLPCRSVSGDRESPPTCLRQAGGGLTLVRELEDVWDSANSSRSTRPICSEAGWGREINLRSLWKGQNEVRWPLQRGRAGLSLPRQGRWRRVLGESESKTEVRLKSRLEASLCEAIQVCLHRPIPKW
jgi:hypothetical protein